MQLKEVLHFSNVSLIQTAHAVGPDRCTDNDKGTRGPGERGGSQVAYLLGIIGDVQEVQEVGICTQAAHDLHHADALPQAASGHSACMHISSHLPTCPLDRVACPGTGASEAYHIQ